MIHFDRYDNIKVEDAIEYIKSLPWEDQEFCDISPLEDLMVILKAESYEDFETFGVDSYGKDYFRMIGEWLHKKRHDKMKKAREETYHELVEFMDKMDD